jgi:transcriptional regulator with XRE-family HTH domain
MRTYTGQQLKQLRKIAGLTIREAAEMTCTPQRTWENWEIDPSLPSHRKPPGIVFAFMVMYIQHVLKKKI